MLREDQLLEFLIRSPATAFTREQLSDECWTGTSPTHIRRRLGVLRRPSRLARTSPPPPAGNCTISSLTLQLLNKPGFFGSRPLPDCIIPASGSRQWEPAKGEMQ